MLRVSHSARVLSHEPVMSRWSWNGLKSTQFTCTHTHAHGRRNTHSAHQQQHCTTRRHGNAPQPCARRGRHGVCQSRPASPTCAQEATCGCETHTHTQPCPCTQETARDAQQQPLVVAHRCEGIVVFGVPCHVVHNIRVAFKPARYKAQPLKNNPAHGAWYSGCAETHVCKGATSSPVLLDTSRPPPWTSQTITLLSSEPLSK